MNRLSCAYFYQTIFIITSSSDLTPSSFHMISYQTIFIIIAYFYQTIFIITSSFILCRFLSLSSSFNHVNTRMIHKQDVEFHDNIKQGELSIPNTRCILELHQCHDQNGYGLPIVSDRI